MTYGGMRNHKERVSWTHFRWASRGTAPGRGRKSGNRWLCSRDRRKAGPVPPGGNVESCPCIDHLGTEARESPRSILWRSVAHLHGSFLISTHTSAKSPLPGRVGRRLFTRALAAGLAVTGSFPGGLQVKGAPDAEGLVGGQALELPCLHATLAGARTLGRPPLPNQTFAACAPGSS